MTVKELVVELEKCDPKATVLVDTEAAEYTVHCVDVTSVWQAIPENIVLIDLDDSVKRHG